MAALCSLSYDITKKKYTPKIENINVYNDNGALNNQNHKQNMQVPLVPNS